MSQKAKNILRKCKTIIPSKRTVLHCVSLIFTDRLVSCTLFSFTASCFQFPSFNALPVTYLLSLSTIPVGSWMILSDVTSTWSRNDNALTSFPSSFCFFISSSIFLHCSKLAWHWSNIGFVSGISVYSRL